MKIMIPFEFRPPLNTRCGHCGNVQKIIPSINITKYLSAPEYLDGFKVGFETEYFNTKFEFCEKCDNFGRTICYDNTKDFKKEKIQSILKSPMSKIEKALTIQMELSPKELQVYLDLYWFYDIHNIGKEILNMYRNILIEELERLYKKKHLIQHLSLIIELYRRKGDFETALKYADKMNNHHNNDIGTKFTETMVIKQEIDLCKKKISTRQKFELKNYKPRFF